MGIKNIGVAMANVSNTTVKSLFEAIFSSCYYLPYYGNDCQENGNDVELYLPQPPPRTLPVGLKGLQNSGNLCFMNSAIQCLSNTVLLKNYIVENYYLSDINYRTSVMRGALIRTFGNVIKDIWSTRGNNSTNLLSLKTQMAILIPLFGEDVQQDAQEFLRYLLFALHEDLNKAVRGFRHLFRISKSQSDREKSKYAWTKYINMNRSKLIDIFVGQLKSVLKCTKCGYRSVTFEPFWDLSLPIPQTLGPKTLTHCLELFTTNEVLEAKCEKCDKNRKFHKKYVIDKLPKVLMIHLKRFAPTETSFRSKIDDFVCFPVNGWNIGNFISGSKPCVYNLYAVCNHSGSISNGHYTAYCKHPFTGQWHNFDDASVTPLNENSIVNSNAYILFFELQDKTNRN